MAQKLNGGDGITLKLPQATGSMGCLVRYGGELMILTSGHVLTRSGEGNTGESVFAVEGDGAEIATLAEAVAPFPAQPLPLYWIDAALARVTDSSAVSAGIGDWGPPKSEVASVVRGQRAYMWGATTGQKGGRIEELNWSGVLKYRGVPINFAGLVRWDRLSADGDSGAVVVDTHMRVVGLHVAGDGTSSYFCPIATLLRQWPGMTIVDSDNGF